MFLKDVAKEVCCGVKKVQKLATAENWDKTKNIKKNVCRLHLKPKSNFEYIKELSKYQKQFESGVISTETILQKTGKTENFFYKYIKYHNWDLGSAKINRIKLKYQKNKKAFEKPKEKDISDKQTEKLIFKNEKTIQGVLKKYCKDNINKDIEKVLMVDGHLMQVKIHNRKVQVEHKPYLLQTYTEEYIKYVEAQKM